MADEKNNSEEPVRFTDKRRVDPETGEARTPEGEEATLEDSLAEAERLLADVSDEAAEDAEEPTADRTAELEDDLRRVQAEYVNYRRRVERDRGLEKDRVKGQLISELMPVLDDIAAARAAGDLEDGPFAHIAGRLEQVLGHEGLVTLGEVGEKFDPTEHEAILQQPHEDVEADHVAIVVRSGYRFGDRLLRAAQVIVSTGPAE